MGDSRKVLTVSYGRFSCRLEGIDDPLSAMKTVTDHLHRLATADPQGDAGPAMTPEALRRLVRAEIAAGLAGSGEIAADGDGPQGPAPAVPVERTGTLQAGGDLDPSRGRNGPGAPDGADPGGATRDGSVRGGDVQDGAFRDRAGTPSPGAASARRPGPRIAGRLARIRAAAAGLAHPPAIADTDPGLPDHLDSLRGTLPGDLPPGGAGDRAPGTAVSLATGATPEANGTGAVPAVAPGATQARDHEAVPEPTGVPGPAAMQSVPADAPLPRPDPAAPEGPARSRALAPGNGDEAQFSRLMEEADSKLAGPELRRRRSALAHLRAAIAATRAEQRSERPPEIDQTRGFRDDFRQIAPPAPLAPAPSAGAATGAAPGRPARMPAPERTDDPDPSRETMLADESDIFEAFVWEMGAEGLEDLLECAAAYAVHVRGQKSFTHPQLLHLLHQLDSHAGLGGQQSLRAFDALVARETFLRNGPAQFTLCQSSRFIPR